jgi:hypothetical protein
MQAHQYYGFDDWNSVAANFEQEIGPEGDLVYALYSKPPGEGSADVVFRRNGEWRHAGGGHCSCYGLEGQWRPETFDPAIHIEALKQGKRYFYILDTEGDYPEATPEAFDAWLQWAVAQP